MVRDSILLLIDFSLEFGSAVDFGLASDIASSYIKITYQLQIWDSSVNSFQEAQRYIPLTDRGIITWWLFKTCSECSYSYRFGSQFRWIRAHRRWIYLYNNWWWVLKVSRQREKLETFPSHELCQGWKTLLECCDLLGTLDLPPCDTGVLHLGF